jgi:hypothetical protein
MEESGLFSMQDPFPQMEDHQTNQCQIQVVHLIILIPKVMRKFLLK